MLHKLPVAATSVLDVRKNQFHHLVVLNQSSAGIPSTANMRILPYRTVVVPFRCILSPFFRKTPTPEGCRKTQSSNRLSPFLPPLRNASDYGSGGSTLHVTFRTYALNPSLTSCVPEREHCRAFSILAYWTPLYICLNPTGPLAWFRLPKP